MITKLLMTILFKIKKPNKPKKLPEVQNSLIQERLNMTHFPVILLELGNVQVYHFQTRDEHAAKMPYTECWWRSKETHEAYGPFDTIYQACNHYTWKSTNKELSNLIKVDFRSKKKLT